MLHSYNQKPVAPAYLMEGHYDLENVGDPPDFGTPLVLRKQNYWTMLTGGIGQVLREQVHLVIRRGVEE